MWFRENGGEAGKNHPSLVKPPQFLQVTLVPHSVERETAPGWKSAWRKKKKTIIIFFYRGGAGEY